MVNWLRRKTSWREIRLLVIDLEMTGLNAEEDSIVSAGTVVIEQGRIQLSQSEHHYFQATSLMGEDVTTSAHIHMITDEQREQAGESIEEWLERLHRELHADAWVFHHAPIDLSFLKATARRSQVTLPKVDIYDTLVRERESHPNEHLEHQSQLSLNACRARYNLPVYRQHHALSDALATAELFIAQKVSREA